jgi:acetyl esterase/lipase
MLSARSREVPLDLERRKRLHPAGPDQLWVMGLVIARVGRRLRWATPAVVAVMVAALWLVARGPSSPPLQHLDSTRDYLPAVAADIFLPATPSRKAPVVVLIPGGSWHTADRTGLGPLADSLAAHGMFVVNATYRAADGGVRFPVPASDIVCAVDFAVDQARRHGVIPDRIFLLGHSAGAELGALVALEPQRFRHNCPYPPATPDGFIGLAGTYDIDQWQSLAYAMLGATGSQDPELWREANAMTWVKGRTGPNPLFVLLAHGSDDSDVPTESSRAFASALTAAGHPVHLTIIPGATHQSIYRPRVISATIIDWINDQTSAPHPKGATS